MSTASSPESLFSLENKTAFVTGASRGFGREIALACAKAGADVAILARSTDELQKLAADIELLGRKALVLTCDVSNAGQIARSVSHTLSEFGRVDIVVNNAATVDCAGPFLDLTFQDWVQTSRINLESMLHVCYGFGPHLIRQGSGSVINVASIAGTTGFPFLSFYAAAKAAMLSFSRSLAAEWARSGVRVNALAPGWHATELTKNFLGVPEISEGIVRQIPSGRWGEPDEIVGAAIYLASDASRNTTGSCLTVDGGQTAFTGGPGMTDMLKLGRITNT